MNINLQIRFSTKEYVCLCFTHAVQEAMKGVKVETEIDDFGSNGNDMRQTYCQVCSEIQDKEIVESKGDTWSED